MLAGTQVQGDKTIGQHVFSPRKTNLNMKNLYWTAQIKTDTRTNALTPSQTFSIQLVVFKDIHHVHFTVS